MWAHTIFCGEFLADYHIVMDRMCVIFYPQHPEMMGNFLLKQYLLMSVSAKTVICSQIQIL